MRLQTDSIDTPVGTVVIVTDDHALWALDYADCRPRMLELLRRRGAGEPALRTARDPLGVSARVTAYFGGDLQALEDVPAEPGGTPFQRRVWQALRDIPAGETRSYGELAAAVGRPGSARAVGAANGANPIALALPCHRVVGADGRLTGYAGGLERKRWLLTHEQVRLGRPPRLGTTHHV